ncbi:MAG: hypothetical protein ACRD5M_01690 [Candidatus Acidiferrales bacterium]
MNCGLSSWDSQFFHRRESRASSEITFDTTRDARLISVGSIKREEESLGGHGIIGIFLSNRKFTAGEDV